MLALDGLVDAPAFELPATTVEALTITPVDAAGGDEPNQVADRPDAAEPPTPVVPTTESASDSALPWFAAGALVLAAVLLVGRVLLRRRSAPTG